MRPALPPSGCSSNHCFAPSSRSFVAFCSTSRPRLRAPDSIRKAPSAIGVAPEVVSLDAKVASPGVEVAHARERGARVDRRGRGEIVEVHEAAGPGGKVGREERQQRARVPGRGLDGRRRRLADRPGRNVESAPPAPRLVRAGGADVGEGEPASRDLEGPGHEIPARDEQAQVGVAMERQLAQAHRSVLDARAGPRPSRFRCSMAPRMVPLPAPSSRRVPAAERRGARGTASRSKRASS